MPFQKIQSVGLEYALLSFDENGVERANDPEGGQFSRAILRKASSDRPSHIFLFSHGWKGDMPSAIDQYNRWIGAMWKMEADRAAMGASFRPMFIGLHWPSQPWGDEKIAERPSSAGASFDAAGAAAPVQAPDVDALFQEAVAQFGDRPQVRESLRVIFNAYAANPGAIIVPEDALAAYQQLASDIGFSAGGGPEAAPDEEGAPLDPQEAANASRIVDMGASFGIVGTVKKGILGGLRQLSFWTMKKRGRAIGEGGMHKFVAELMNQTNARIHLMGHSFGCVVVSSILGGPDGRGRLPRPVNSAVLVQGAVSLWSWGDKVKDRDTPGYYRNILASGAVAGPVVTTRSAHDSAVGLAYPAAVALVGQAAFDPNTADLPLFGGIGSFGIQGTSVAESRSMLDGGAQYGFRSGRVYNLESSDFIDSHSGIDGPQVAHAIWEAAR